MRLQDARLRDRVMQPEKRIRLEDPDGTLSSEGGVLETVESWARSENDRDDRLDSWSLEPVLSADVTSEVPVTGVLVGTIVDKKHTSRLIQELNAMSPLPSLGHLKRCHNGRVVVALAEGSSSADCLQGLKDKGADLTGLSDDRWESQRVAATKPITRAQYTRAMSLWPVNFHENKYLERVLNGTLFDGNQLLRIQSFMTLCLTLGARAKAGVAAAVVDPSGDGGRGQVVAVGVDDRRRHPVKHAAMVVVDLVARGQGGGCWPLDETRNYLRRLSSDCGVSEERTHQKRGAEEGEGRKTGPYLCTGYDVYVTREPCTMCAMALVHSRARRVFYGCAVKGTGALGSTLQMHVLNNLNHNYEVFRGVLARECRQLADKWLCDQTLPQ